MRLSPQAILKFPGDSRWASARHDNLRSYAQVDWEGLDSREIDIKTLSLTFLRNGYIYSVWDIHIYNLISFKDLCGESSSIKHET